MFQRTLLFSILILATVSGFCQKKSIAAVRTSASLVIDGRISEDAWKASPIATDFIMFAPDNGKKIADAQRTEVRFLYDDEAVYIAAHLKDDPKLVLKEISQRDIVGTADMFGVFLNGFNDGQQDFQFFVTASGVQLDRLATEDGEVNVSNFSQDMTWDAIWDSATQLTDDGWTVEIKIPYAALRFSKEQIQNWGINFYREIRRDRQVYTWNFVDAKIAATRVQNGILTGIQDIKTPTRLFFIPYASYYYEDTPAGVGNTVKAGMDIKYGINDAFTLDAILVPDFGQTRFDNVILNLTPFEQQFDENRPFFTEGTDLFSKANLLYTRRIGAPAKFRPRDFDPSTEQLTDQPVAVDLLNALKVSGRTKSGLGVGVLNAITEETYGTFTNNETGATRRAIIEPLTNYNVFVLDQRFSNNSSVTYTNTSVLRNGHYRDATVSAVNFDLYTKDNGYNLFGDFKYSSVFDATYIDGFKSSLNFEKTSGKWRYVFFGKYLSDNYEVNDLGILFQTNYHNAYAEGSYRILNPVGWFNSLNITFRNSVEIQNNTGKLQDYFHNISIAGTSTKNDYYSFEAQYNPRTTFDFYMPEVEGRYNYVPGSYILSTYFSSNYNRAFALDVNLNYRKFFEENRIDYVYRISPRIRVSDQVLLIAGTSYSRNIDDLGSIGLIGENGEIFYTRRTVKTITTDLTGRYALNNRMTFNLTARHYWLTSRNKRNYTLRNDGFMEATDFIEGIDDNFGAFNLDLSYTWWFAPASQITVLYRNSAQDYRNDLSQNYGRSFQNLFAENMANIFSVSFRYYIDYNAAKNWF